MAQNFLYMFEFVVDEVLITRPNACAPEEYPTCCEISFRSSVYVTIYDREFGQCPDPCNSKCGKCCLFSLESPVTDKDRLLIHVYKKKTEQCKFLLGATDLPVKPLFERVTENFNIENPSWEEALNRHLASMPDPRQKTKVIDNNCEDILEGRREQQCPMSELSKRLLPLFNMRGVQTGNIVLIMRLVCNGPTIVSSFPFSKFCASTCKPCEQTCDGICPAAPPPPTGPCVQPDPCKKPSTTEIPCRRYFACNQDKECPCNACEDEYDREAVCPDKKKKRKSKSRSGGDPCSPCRSCGGYCDACEKCIEEELDSPSQCFGPESQHCCPCHDETDECEAASSGEEEKCCAAKPCFIELSRPMPGPEAYEEFEACLNGSGLKIRVLKDTHQVSNVYDGFGEDLDVSDDDCAKCQRETPGPKAPTMQDVLQTSTYARNQVKRSTAGRIINNSKLPKIRANIKYAAANDCGESYHVPFDKIKQMCDDANRAEFYRVKGGCDEDCTQMIPHGAPATRGACLQIDQNEINNAMSGINADTRKKGIEVCYKTCDETDSDVFLVKLGSKKRCEEKRNAIEIELKTPKQAVVMPKQKVTTTTQVTGNDIDAAISGKGGKGKGKGKKGKK